MRHAVRKFAALSIASGLLPNLAAAGDMPHEHISALPAADVDGLVARFAAEARWPATPPSGPFELRIWSEMAGNVYGEIFAGGHWHFMRPGDVQDSDTADVLRREEIIVTVPGPDAAVVDATRALMAFDQRSTSCEDVMDGAFLVIQASVDGHPLLLAAANPGMCRGELSGRVEALLRAVGAVAKPYWGKPK